LMHYKSPFSQRQTAIIVSPVELQQSFAFERVLNI
jgi:hypothetical protein